MSIARRTAAMALLTLAALALAPDPASAVLGGTNGRIVMVSGRGEPSDATAKLFLRPAFGSAGAGSASAIGTATGAGQHRHPTWSPDRTKIAYARGDTAGANYDIYILDLTSPGAAPQNITNSNAVTDDRPAWSPDGETIAFESENVDGSGQLNLKLYDVEAGTTADFTPTGAGTYEHKPAWTPDSQTLFYSVGDPAGTNMNIVRQELAGGGPSNVLADPSANEFQPSVSPDGTELCFTRATGSGFNGTARVRVSLLNGGGQMELPGNNGIAGYNCTWSPDGTKILYVQGTFSSGDLVMERSDLSGGLLPLESTAGRFDGNPDWAPDGRPGCEDQIVRTPAGVPATVPLDCADTGPNYERTSVRAFVRPEESPANGTVENDVKLLPADVTYTPDVGFTGTDSFAIRSFDEVAFGDRDGTVTVEVLDFKLGRVIKNRKKGTAELVVGVPGAGELVLSGSKTVRRATRPAPGAGRVRLDVRPRGRAAKRLAAKGRAKVRATVTYTADGGSPRTKTKRVNLRRK